MNTSPSQLRDAAQDEARRKAEAARNEFIDKELAYIRENAQRWIEQAAKAGESHYLLYQSCFVNARKTWQCENIGRDWEFKRDGSGTIVMDNLMNEVWILCQNMASDWQVRIELHNHTSPSYDRSFAEAHNYCICAVW